MKRLAGIAPPAYPQLKVIVNLLSAISKRARAAQNERSARDGWRALLALALPDRGAQPFAELRACASFFARARISRLGAKRIVRGSINVYDPETLPSVIRFVFVFVSKDERSCF